ncbi:MAG: NADP oxidoreductase [Candidatus Riflebacteria bacterium HGW-Riflebacteria-1]|jgi:NADP-reducing hydrogenase subunit HndB|nr:MAG: NADP oxidoreductase [Candidatus Riflebacteria bacterium HGW-Riflebacteria-1]
MEKVTNVEQLKALQSALSKEAEQAASKKVIIRIAMATCSIASGAKPVLDFFTEEMPRQPLEFIIKSTGCTGLCHSEPTVEVTLPGKAPVMFGKVDVKKANEIVNDYIKGGKQIEGILEVSRS